MTDWNSTYEVNNLEFYRQHHGQQLYYRWEGAVWWRLSPESELEKIFAIAGMNATKVFLCSGEKGEYGHRINRELGLYCDPVTGTVLTQWQPFPNQSAVPVVPIANRVVQGDVSPKTTTIPAGEAYLKKVQEIPLTYPHPLADDPKYRDNCPGDTFHGTEYFTTYATRPGVVAPTPLWARDCPWLPWMKMGYGHPARLRFETTIKRVDDFDELNPNLIEVIRQRIPIYEHTPDAIEEPNVTSTTYFKKHFSAYQSGETFPIIETA